MNSHSKLCPISKGTGPCPLYGPVIGGKFGRKEREELEKAAKIHRYEKGERISNEGASKAAIIVLEGCLVVSQLNGEQGRSICRIAWPGELLPFPFWGEGRESEIVCAEKSVTCQIDLEQTDEGSCLHQTVKAKLFDLTRNEIDVYRQRVATLTGKNATAQLASFLVDLLERNKDGALQIRLPITRHDIGDYLGHNHATIARKFSDLKKAGVIELPTPWDVVVRDAARLRQIANGNA